MFTKIFYNNVENRLRAGWRIYVFTSLLIVFGIALNSISASSLFFTLGLALLVLMLLWIAADFLDNRSFKEYGLSINKDWIQDFIAGVFIAAVSMGVIFVILLSLDWVTITETSLSITIELISYLIFMIAVSVWEEGFFRSYLIPNLKEGVQWSWVSAKWAVIFALLLSSLLFSLGHLANPGATYLSTLNIFLAGAVLGYPFVATGSIALPVGLHFAWNYFQSAVFGLPVSGNQFYQGILKSDVSGPELFTGGEFGPEGGIIGLIGLIVMIIFIHIYVILWKRKVTK